MNAVDWPAVKAAWQAEYDAPPETRWIPTQSGEAAIYSPEYLARKEGNALGADPERWRHFPP